MKFINLSFKSGFDISTFPMFNVLVTYKSRSTKFRKEVESTIQIISWSDSSDYIVISHIAISGFLMSIIFDMSNSWSPKLWHGVHMLMSHVLNNCHVSPWFVTYMCLACWISLTLVITWLCHVFLVDVVFWRESDRQLKCDLDLMAQITSWFFISQNRDSYCIISLTSPTRDPWNVNMV